MTFVVEMALEWLGVGSLVAVAVLTEHLLSTSRFPGRASLRLMPVVTVAWPWTVWVWYATRNAQTRRTGGTPSIGLVTIVLVGALGLGWVCGSRLYSLVYEPEPTDKAAIDAMIERIIYAESNARNEHLDETGVELILASPIQARRETGRNKDSRIASRPGT